MANLNLSQFGENTSVSDADYTFVWDSANAISKRVSRNSWLSAGSIATSTPLTISQTWTDAAVAFAAMKIVATDTNSAAGSDFLELYSGTATQPLRLDIQKTGQLNIYGTWSNSTSYERLSFSAPTAANAIIGTNKGGGGGTARGLEFQTDGVTRMTIASGGATTFSSTITGTIITATNFIGVPAGNGLIPALGGGSDFIKIGNNSGSELARVGYFGTAATSYISFGGVANTSPALKRSTTYLQARLADDSAFAPIQGKLTTDTAYTATVVAATGYITIYDSTGTAYRVPCAV